MITVVCPYCYHRINRLRLWFVCTGRPAPGYKPCEKLVNENRQNETGYKEETYPAFAPPSRWLKSPQRARCPHCKGRTGRHACPCCNSPVPQNFGGRSSPVIAMAGARATGKTVYLTVLAHQLLATMGNRFEADVTLHGDEAQTWYASNVESLINQRVLPPLTRQLAGRSEPLVFRWRRDYGRVLRRYRSSFLSFLDTAGENLGTQRGAEDLKFLGGVDGFIVLLDPFALPGAQERIGSSPAAPSAASQTLQVLNQVTSVLRGEQGVPDRRRIRIPVAVAFAKIDVLKTYLGTTHAIFRPEADRPSYDERAGRAMHDSIRNLLIEWGAGDVDTHLQTNYSRFRYFAVSSLGKPPDYNHGVVDAGGVKPHRVSEPLVWLLSRYKVVRRQGR